MLFLLVLAGLTLGLDPACEENEFLVNGYSTGQNIDIDLDGTEITIDEDPLAPGIDVTYLTVSFLVPQRYYAAEKASSYAITFNRKTTLEHHTGTVDQVKTGMYIDNGDEGIEFACYTNRYHDGAPLSVNRTQSSCMLEENAGIWSDQGRVGTSCLYKMQAKVKWEDVMTNQWFGNVEIKDDGDQTQVFLMATVETWTRFTQTTGADYKGQMTGVEQKSNVGGVNDRTEAYSGDGGDPDVHFPALHMDDERYTLYQIPFILRFPKTVIVETKFTVGTAATILVGTVKQDTIRVNFNPSENTGDMADFAALDVTVNTVIQYPYAIRDPQDEDSPMTVRPGPNRNRGDQDPDIEDPAKAIYFLRYDSPDTCRANQDGDACSQDFVMRITPKATRPCSVAGSYTMEFWAKCVGGIDTDDQDGPDQCSLDVLNFDPDLDTRRDNNGYFTHTFQIDHTNFCPEVIDTVYVRATMKAYHDEAFAQEVTSSDVYTNDILFYEVTYRTSTTKNGEFDSDFINNDPTPKTHEDDMFIDYVRAVDIYVDITIGVDMDNEATATTWETSGANGWKDNISWVLGGNRLAKTDFEDSPEIQIINSPDSQNADADKNCGTECLRYRISLCSVEQIEASTIQEEKEKPRDCFDEPYEAVNGDANPDGSYTIDDSLHAADSRGKIAMEYFDFNKVNVGKSAEGAANTIDENEIAFKLRLDERIVPVGPKTDDSHIKMTVESEVYYKGNRHPSRRRLQGLNPGFLNKQLSVQTYSVPIHFRKPELKKCELRPTESSAVLDMTLKFQDMNDFPDTHGATDWAATMEVQLGNIVSASHAIKVVHMQTRDKVLNEITKSQTMPLAKDELFFKLQISSSKSDDAGVIANYLQDAFIGGDLNGVEAFRSSTITSMKVPACTDTDLKFANKLASSAALASSMVALVIATINFLW